jgi:hypothetical protein
MVVTLVFAGIASGTMLTPVGAADPSELPLASPSPLASEPAEAMCDSLANLRLYVGFVRDQSVKDDGLLPILVGVVASLSEAHTLAGLVGETYRPLADDLVTSLTNLKVAVRTLFDQGTIGAGLVQLGAAITDVGTKLDTLSAAIREPCPDESPSASPLPSPSASPES